MNKIICMLLAILAILCIVNARQLRFESAQQDTQPTTFKMSSSYTFYKEIQIEELISTLKGQEVFTQLGMIKVFMNEHHLFFTAKQIATLLKSTVANTLMSNYFIEVIKPYIPLLSTEEANKIIQQIYSPQDGLAFSTIVSQIYDMKNENLNAFRFSIGEDDNFQDKYLIPQSKKSFSNGFKLTSEGQHVGLLINRSKSMSTVAFKKEDGTVVTRYNLAQEFLNSKLDILQDFSAFTYGEFTSEEDTLPYYGMSQYTQGFSVMGLDFFIQNTEGMTGESDFLGSLQRFLQIPYDQISDLYIITDGSVTKGSRNIEDYVKFINENNGMRKTKVRINIISVLVGGEEDSTQRTESTKLMKTISHITGGTFMQL